MAQRVVLAEGVEGGGLSAPQLAVLEGVEDERQGVGGPVEEDGGCACVLGAPGVQQDDGAGRGATPALGHR